LTGIFGEVQAKTDDSITVKLKDGSTVQLVVDAETKIKTGDKDASGMDAVPVGSRVAVLAENTTSSPAALRVMVVPGQPQREHRTFTLVEANGNIVVVEDETGNRLEIEIDHEISDAIAGELATFLLELGPQSNRLKAKAEMKISNVVKRLEAQAQKLDREAKSEAQADAKARKEKAHADVTAKLEANMQRQLDLFAEVIADAPPQAKAALERARDNTVKGYEQALKSVGASASSTRAVLGTRVIEGEVTAVSEDGSRITVTSKRGAAIELKLDANSRVTTSANATTTIEVGDEVTAKYEAATSTAVSVRVHADDDDDDQDDDNDGNRGRSEEKKPASTPANGGASNGRGSTISVNVKADAGISIGR